MCYDRYGSVSLYICCQIPPLGSTSSWSIWWLRSRLPSGGRPQGTSTQHKWLTLNDFQPLRPACVALWQRTPPWERFDFTWLALLRKVIFFKKHSWKTWPIWNDAFHLPASSRKLLARLPVCKDKAWSCFTAVQSSTLKLCISQNMSHETWGESMMKRDLILKKHTELKAKQSKPIK